MQVSIGKRKSDKVTLLQSETLLNSLLTMSLGCICYLRGFFDDNHFQDQIFKVDPQSPDPDSFSGNNKTDYIRLKTLSRGNSKEADTLIDWLEKSCFPAIKLKYLDKISLSILLDNEKPQEIYESYVFQINYENNELIDLSNCRRSIQQLMKQFIITAQTLPLLPEKRYISMRLLFNNTAPWDYQPELFHDISYTNQEYGFRVPINDTVDLINCGEVQMTNHHFQSQIMMLPVFDEMSTTDYHTIDPLTYLNGNEEIFDLDPPVSQVSKELENLIHLNINPKGQNPILFTQALPNVSCECQCDMELDFCPTWQCSKCHYSKHAVCYGSCKRTTTAVFNPPFICMSCSAVNIDNGKLAILMNIRKIVRLACIEEMPNSFNELIKRLGLSKETNQQLVTQSFDYLFSIKLFTISSNPLVKLQSQSQSNKSNITALLTPPDTTNSVLQGKGVFVKGSNWFDFTNYQSNTTHGTPIKALNFILFIRNTNYLSSINMTPAKAKKSKEYIFDFNLNRISEFNINFFNDDFEFEINKYNTLGNQHKNNIFSSSSRPSSRDYNDYVHVNHNPLTELDVNINNTNTNTNTNNVLIFDSNYSQFNNMEDNFAESVVKSGGDNEQIIPLNKRRKIAKVSHSEKVLSVCV